MTDPEDFEGVGPPAVSQEEAPEAPKDRFSVDIDAILSNRAVRVVVLAGALFLAACNGGKEPQSAQDEPDKPVAASAEPGEEGAEPVKKLTPAERMAQVRSAKEARQQRARDRIASVKERMAGRKADITARKAEIGKLIRAKLLKIRERKEAKGTKNAVRIFRILTQLESDLDGNPTSKNPSVSVGEPKTRLFPYSKLIEVAPDISAADYFFYIRNKVSSPEEIGMLTRSDNLHPERIFTYKTRGEATIDSVKVVERDGGDCDDLSEFARECLEFLGEKTGFDYKPRVIAKDNLAEKDDSHAVCIYTERDGQMHAIDQNVPEKIDHIDQASGHFDKKRNFRFRELETDYASGSAMNWTLDPRTLEKDYKTLKLTVPNGDFDIDKFNESLYFPEDWEQYDEVWVTVGLKVRDGAKKTQVFYKNGEIQHVAYAKGDLKSIFYKDGQIHQKIYREGDLKSIFYKDGQIEQKTYRAGDLESIFYKDGQIGQKTYRAGPYHYVWYRHGEPYHAEDFSGKQKSL